MVDVSFSDKLSYIDQGTTKIVAASFLIGASLMFFYSFRGEKTYIIIVALCSISFLIYFMPEGFFIRSRHLITLVSFVIAGGASVIIILCEKQFSRIFKSHGKIDYTHYLSIIVVLLIFIPVLYESTIFFRDQLEEYSQKHHAFAAFDVSEYQTGIWLRQSIPHNAIVVSDPYTINLLTEISGLKPPYERKWVEQNEYPEKTLRLMSGIKSNFFQNPNSDERKLVLNNIMNSNNATSAVIIINDRTMKWLSSDQLIYRTYYELNDVKSSTVKSLIGDFPAKVIYTNSEKNYIFEYDLSN